MLLDDIIELATDNEQSISVLLRKCIVLAHQLRNEHLKNWANKELNGYLSDDGLPDYRVIPAQAKGHFSGYGGAQWNYVPIPPAILEEKHRRFATEVHGTQAISAYEHLVKDSNPSGQVTLQWPTNLVLYYQDRLPVQGGMSLLAAYQEIPKPSIVEMLDTVRNRVLNMALELKSELGEGIENLKQITPQQEKIVEQTVVTNIFGGNVTIATGHATANVVQQSITTGDWQHLERVLRNAGLVEGDLKELSTAVQEDGQTTMGAKVMGWVKRNGPKVLSGGVKIGNEIGQKLLAEYLKQYYGL